MREGEEEQEKEREREELDRRKKEGQAYMKFLDQLFNLATVH